MKIVKITILNNYLCLSLLLGTADEFYYTSQGSSPVVASIDDGDDFINTRQAFTMLGKIIG